MFSSLRQGNIIYILEKGDKPVLKIGQVTSVSQPNYNNNFLMNGSTININVKVGEQSMDFQNIVGQLSVASYNNITITETKELMANEVDNMLQNSKSIIDNIPYHKQVIESCESILKELNPQFAKEKERDEDIDNLKSKLGGLETKMDQLLSILAKDEVKK